VTKDDEAGAGVGEPHLPVETAGPLVVGAHVEDDRPPPDSPAPVHGRSEKSGSETGTFPIAAHRDAMKVSHAPLGSHDGVPDHLAPLGDREDAGRPIRGMCLLKGQSAHPPEAFECRPVDRDHRVPVRLRVDANVVIGRYPVESLEAPLHHREVCVVIEAATSPDPCGSLIEGGGVGLLRPHRRQRFTHRPQELGTTPVEPDHGLGDDLVPRTGSGAEPACGERDRIRQGALDVELCQHFCARVRVMDVIVANHPASLLHDTGQRHPERPDRVEAVLAGLRDSGAAIHEIISPAIERSELALVHDPSYIETIAAFCAQGGGALDMDTFVSPESWDAALTAAGGVRALAEELESRDDGPGFAICRPPGHHATRNRAMGFCLFNNVAVTAAWLRARGRRVAVVDWDVHHGNGTQDILADDPDALYFSVHQDPFYPFAGGVDDIHTVAAKGTVVNVPLPAGTAGDVYREAWARLAIPVLGQFAPDWVLVSAGYDAHVDDHLADFSLVASDFGFMAATLAEAHPPSRTVFALEGGYDLDALHDSAAATVSGVTGTLPQTGLGHLQSPPTARIALDEATEVISRHWAL